MHTLHRRARFVTLFLFCVAPLGAQQPSASAPPAKPAPAAQETNKLPALFEKREVSIPMRDGVKLFTSLYIPRTTSADAPILLCRTPYSVGPYGAEQYKTSVGPSTLFSDGSWIVAYQDVRGCYMSEGQFVDVRPHVPHVPDVRSCRGVDESTDTYDTIEWLIANVPHNNGKVGMWGISYPGFYAAAGMVDAHPALAAVSPQAPIGDWYFDDFHHHGALFLPHAFNFLSGFGRARPQPTTKREGRFEHGTKDGYDFFLRLGSLANVNERYFHGEIAFWNDLVAHPDYDGFWQERNLLPDLKRVAPAVLTVGGWYDAEDLYGALNVYRAIETQEERPDFANSIVMGPWAHGGWARGDGDKLGIARFGDKTSVWYREKVELPFFERALKGKQVDAPAEATMFDTGANEWRTFDRWPPKLASDQEIGLDGGGELKVNGVGGASGFDEFTSDPAKPVPYTEAVAIGMTREYMTDDQRFASRRPDVLTYRSAVLTQDVTLCGPIAAELLVSTSGTDSDWIVKLIDVLPDDAKDPEDLAATQHYSGAQLLVRSEVLRGRYRNSNSKPEAFVPNEPTRVVVPLQDVLHTFRTGHRIEVQVQCTWFPLVDRNPQTFVPNIFLAKESDFVKATQRVYWGGENGSRLRVHVVRKPQGERSDPLYR